MAAVLVLAVAACGSDPATTSPTVTETATTAASTTSDTPTSTATTVAATTTTTTIAPTTTPTTTTTTAFPPVVPAGWSQTDVESVSPKAFPPCCADTWHGDISPDLTPEGQPLADGPYAVAFSMQWPDDLAQPLELELFRFEQCALLPETSREFSCESLGEGFEFTSDDLGVDASASRTMTIALDDRVRVVVVGWDDAASDGRMIEQANGTDLARLATEVDRAHAEVFGNRFIAGEDRNAIVADVLAKPTGGFSASASGFESFVFTPQNGPTLLFQYAFGFVDGQRVAGRGTDVLGVRSIEVVDGQVTLYVYAALYP